MSIQTITLAGRRFVILPESDYRKLAKTVASKNGKPARTRLSAQDRGDIAEAKRRANEPARPYAQLRKSLGLE